MNRPAIPTNQDEDYIRSECKRVIMAELRTDASQRDSSTTEHILLAVQERLVDRQPTWMLGSWVHLFAETRGIQVPVAIKEWYENQLAERVSAKARDLVARMEASDAE